MMKVEDKILNDVEKINDFLIPLRDNKFEIDPIGKHDYLSSLNSIVEIKNNFNQVIKNKVKLAVDDFNSSTEKNKEFPIGEIHNTFHYNLGKDSQLSESIVYVAKNIGIKGEEMNEYFSQLLWKDDGAAISYFIHDAYENGNKKETLELLKNILDKTASREKRQSIERISKSFMSSNSEVMKAFKNEEDRREFFDFFYKKEKSAMANNLRSEVELEKINIEPIENQKYSLENDQLSIAHLKKSLENAILEIQKMPNGNKNYISYLNNMLSHADDCFGNVGIHENKVENLNTASPSVVNEKELEVQEMIQAQKEIAQELDKPDDDFKKLNKLLKIGAAIFIAKTPLFKRLVTDKVIDKITEDKREHKNILVQFKDWVEDKFKMINYDDTTSIKNVFKDQNFTLSEKTNFMLTNLDRVYKKSPEKGDKLIEKLNNDLFEDQSLDHKEVAFAINKLSSYAEDGIKNANQLEVGLFMRDQDMIANEIVLELEKRQRYSMEGNYNLISERLDQIFALDPNIEKAVMDKLQEKLFTFGKVNSNERIMSGLLSNELLKHVKGRRLKVKLRSIDEIKNNLKNVGTRIRNVTENSVALERNSLSVKVAKKLSERLKPKPLMENEDEEEVKKKKKKKLTMI